MEEEKEIIKNDYNSYKGRYVKFICKDKTIIYGEIYEAGADRFYFRDNEGEKRILLFDYIMLYPAKRPAGFKSKKCLEEKITKEEETDENKDRKEDDKDIREADKFLKENKDEFEMLGR